MAKTLQILEHLNPMVSMYEVKLSRGEYTQATNNYTQSLAHSNLYTVQTLYHLR